MKKLNHVVIQLSILVSLIYPAYADIPQEDFEFFLEESYSPYGRNGTELNLEDQFYDIAKRENSPEKAVAAFAIQAGLTVEEAEAYALAMIESVKFREACRGGYDPVACAFTPDTNIHRHLVTTGFSNENGEIAVIIGKAIQARWEPGTTARAVFIRVIADHPAQETILLELVRYSVDDIWIAALLNLNPHSFENAVTSFWGISSSSMYDQSFWSGSMMTVLETSYRAGGRSDDLDVPIASAQSLMALQFKAGLQEAALRTWRQLPGRHRERFFLLGDRIQNARLKVRYTSEIYELGNNLAAALFWANDIKAAEKVLSVLSSVRTTATDALSPTSILRTRAITDVISHQYSADDLYDMYIHGRLEGELEVKPRGRRERPGWLFSVRSASPIVLTIIARRLTDSSLPEMGHYIIEGQLYYRDTNPIDRVMAISDMMPRDFGRRKKNWSRHIDRAWQARERVKEERQAASYESLVVSSGMPVVYEELALPEGLQRNDCDEGKSPETRAPENVFLPVNPGQIVRYEEKDGRKAIVFLSADLDSPGEIPAFGYWFQRTMPDGMRWEPPLYLGLQKFFPYVVLSSSKLPMMGADGKINIEVDAREIDPASITFPPVGLALKREECNLYLSFDLNALQRDRDGDDLTDIVESRIGLSPTNPDTDGDGIDDGRDSLPLTPFNLGGPKVDTELAISILTEIIGFERHAIMIGPRSPGEEPSPIFPIARSPQYKIDPSTIFLVADPEIFQGVRLPIRLVVYSPGDVKKLDRGPAPFYPVKVSRIFSKPDQTEKYVIWSASWTGGEFLVRCKDGKCKTEITSQWIT